MARPKIYPIKKLIAFDAELWEQVREYRFSARLNTESDAVRNLIEAGLNASDKLSSTSPGRSGPAAPEKPSRTDNLSPRLRKPRASKQEKPASPLSKEAQLRAMREQGVR